MFLQLKPEYGVNYKSGQVYFTFTIDSPISEGVTWFTCKNDSELSKVSHCGVCIGEGKGLGALAEKNRFDYQDLNELFSNPKTRIFFKEPLNLDLRGAQDIINVSKSLISTPYNYRLAAGMALTGSWLGRNLLNQRLRRQILKKFDDPGHLLCSQAVMQIMYVSCMNYDIDFLKTPYEVLTAPFLKEWK